MRTLVSRADAAGEELASQPTLDKVLSSLSHPKPAVVVAGCRALQAMASKRGVHAGAIIDAGGISHLRRLLESFDVDVKEAATRCLAAAAESGPAPADAVVAEDDGAVLDALCLIAAAADAPLTLRAAVVRTFDACCRQGEDITARVMETDAAATAARLARDCAFAGSGLGAGAAEGVRRRARASGFACLASMARHADDLATMVMDVGALGDARAALTEDDVAFPEESAATREAAAALLRELASKTPELAEAVASDGGVDALVQCLALERGDARAMIASQTLGYVADFRPSLAAATVAADEGRRLVEALEQSADSDASLAAAWAIGCAARHGRESAAPLAKSGALKALLDCYVSVEAHERPALKERAKASLKHVVKNCGSLSAIEPLVSPETPGVILRHVLAEFAAKLGGDVRARRAFVTGGGLMRLQKVLKAHDARVKEDADARAAAEKGAEMPPEREPVLDERGFRDAKKINAYFPADVVGYYMYC